MESTISATTTPLLTLSKTLNSSSSLVHRHFSKSLLRRTLQKRFSSSLIRCITNADFHKSFHFISSSSSSFSSSSNSLRSLYLTAPLPPRLACISASAASFVSGGSTGDGGSGGRGGGGDCGGNAGDGSWGGGEFNSKSKEIHALPPDVIILDVAGMTCGGCAASVKRILENQPQVSSASVNLATETAIVWPVTEAKSIHNWQKQLGETLAKHLTNCGFKSNLRGHGAVEENILP